MNRVFTHINSKKAMARIHKNQCSLKPFNLNEIEFIDIIDPYSGPDAAVRALLNNEVDVLFLYESTLNDRRGCSYKGCDPTLYEARLLGESYTWIHTGITEYARNGTTLSFTQKNSSKTNTLLNPCIRKVINSPFYHSLCKRYKNELGYSSINCFGYDDDAKDNNDVREVNEECASK